MTGPGADHRPLLWPDEDVVASLGGRSLGGAALRLTRLPADRSAAPPATPLVLLVTRQRLVVATAPTGAHPGRVVWHLQLPRLGVDLHRLPGQLVIRGADRFLAIQVDGDADVGRFLAALAGPSA